MQQNFSAQILRASNIDKAIPECIATFMQLAVKSFRIITFFYYYYKKKYSALQGCIYSSQNYFSVQL